jgi:hypothetical protein
MFNKITGSGTIQSQGGINNFDNVAGASFQGSGGTTTIKTGNFNTLTVSGATLQGTKISTTSASLSSGVITGGVQIATGALTLQGTITLQGDGTAVTASAGVQVSTNSLITMVGGSMLTFSSGSTVTQAANLQIVPGAPQATKPSIAISGTWTSSAQWSVSEIPISGQGAYTLTSTSSVTFNNVAFAGKSFSSQGSLTIQVGTFNVDSISGSGTINASPISMNVNYLTGSSLTLISGTVTVTNTSLSTLTMKNGVFAIGTVGKINTFSFQGGQVKGTMGQQAMVTVRDMSLEGVTTQTLTNVGITTSTFSMNCGAQACQLFSQNSAIRTATKA